MPTFGVDVGGLEEEVGADGGNKVVTTVVLFVVVETEVTVAVNVAVPPRRMLLQNIYASEVCPTKASRPHLATRRSSVSSSSSKVLLTTVVVGIVGEEGDCLCRIANGEPGRRILRLSLKEWGSYTITSSSWIARTSRWSKLPFINHRAIDTSRESCRNQKSDLHLDLSQGIIDI